MQRKDSFDQLSAMLRMDSLPKLDEGMFARARNMEAQNSNGAEREANATQALRQLSSADLPALARDLEAAANHPETLAAASGGQKRQWSSMDDGHGAQPNGIRHQRVVPGAGGSAMPSTSAGAPHGPASTEDEVDDVDVVPSSHPRPEEMHADPRNGGDMAWAAKAAAAAAANAAAATNVAPAGMQQTVGMGACRCSYLLASRHIGRRQACSRPRQAPRTTRIVWRQYRPP